MKVKREIEFINALGEFDYLQAEFEGQPVKENDSFGYSFGSENGTSKSDDYFAMQSDPTWEKSKYSQDENRIIAAYLAANMSAVCDAFCVIAEAEKYANY